MINNLVTKQGYVLVKPEDSSVYNLRSNMVCSRIIAGADAHKDAIIFHKDDVFVPFDIDYNLVKVEDVLAWIKPEEVKPIEIVEPQVDMSVEANEPQNDQA